MQTTPYQTSTLTRLALIYCGGTFGCHGKPLTPLSDDVFLPILHHITCKHTAHDSLQIQITSHNVKDSSQLNTTDLASLYQYIHNLYEHGTRQFVIIHGTDTLSYTAAFLANAFAETPDIAIHITGSMQPLLYPDATALNQHSVNPQSDALPNLSFALENCHQLGVWVGFAQHMLPAINTHKIHSQHPDAFSGKHTDTALKPIPCQHSPDTLAAQIKKINILSHYCLPTSIEKFEQNIEHLIEQQPDAFILIGFGSGNVPSSAKLTELLKHTTKNGTLVITTTQVPFGGVTTDYAAGGWLAKAGALSGKDLTLPAIYARLLWLCANITDKDKRLTFW